MAESTRLVDLVQADIDRFLDDRVPMLESIAPELARFIDYSRDLLRGGKRFRALFCYWGWQAASGHSRGYDSMSDNEPPSDLPAVVLAASALEIFHAAALVHDDIMDNSDTRRGLPAMHKRFERVHSDSNWIGTSPTFGHSAALLLGDLLLGWSDEQFDSGIRSLRASHPVRASDPESASDPGRAADPGQAARAEFNRMRTEVTAGQYLDILDERAWHSYPEPELLGRAHRVIVYKSAKYSVEAPLVIGAALGGATENQISALREFGLPLGIAYQLRDDLLGVFGDPEITGKPSGDDLREGKRTVLVALARTELPRSSRDLLDELLGDENLSEQQVRMLQASIEDSGAVEKVERIIDLNVRLALTAMTDAPISGAAREQLERLAETVTHRTA